MAGYETYINEDWTKESSFKLYGYWDFIEPLARAIRERSIVLNDDWWIFDKDNDKNLLLPVKLYNSDPTWDILEELHNQITNLIPQYLDISNTYKLDDKPCDGYKNWTEIEILKYIDNNYDIIDVPELAEDYPALYSGTIKVTNVTDPENFPYNGTIQFDYYDEDTGEWKIEEYFYLGYIIDNSSGTDVYILNCTGTLQHSYSSGDIVSITNIYREPYKLNKLDNIINIKWIIQSRKILNALKYIVIDNSNGDFIQKEIIEKYKSIGEEDQDILIAHWEWIGTTGALAFCDTYPDNIPDSFSKVFILALNEWRSNVQDISSENTFDFYTKILFRQNAREESYSYPPPSTVTEYWDKWQRKVYIESKYGSVKYTINIDTTNIPDDIDVEYEVFRCDCEENLLHKVIEGDIDSNKSFIVEYPKKAPTLTETGGEEPHNFFNGNNPYDPNSTDPYERERWASFPKTGLYERTKMDNYNANTLTHDSCNYGIVVLLKPNFQFI